MSEKEKIEASPKAKAKVAAEAVVTPKDVKRVWDEIYNEIKRVIIGKVDVLEDMFIALLGGGHCLLEGVPGIAKTLIARTLSKIMGCEFKRIQFTPDMLPGDITGVSVYNQKTNDFEFRPGPIMSQIVLADEINPKN